MDRAETYTQQISKYRFSFQAYADAAKICLSKRDEYRDKARSSIQDVDREDYLATAETWDSWAKVKWKIAVQDSSVADRLSAKADVFRRLAMKPWLTIPAEPE